MGWHEVQGHDALIAGFRRVVERGRLAHAYLFVGPAGVGKRLFAKELARALLCEKVTTLEACDRCPSCLQVGAGTHPDFVSAGRPAEALEFPIELMRNVCAGFALKPARGRGKVVVIDDADDLNDESANCFLKTLEEPPPRSVLILIGSSPERQLPTIVSRCQVVRFGALPPEVVDALLQNQEIDDPAQRQRLVRLSGGSPGVALELADEALWEFRDRFLALLCAAPPDPVGLIEELWAFVESAGKESAAQRARAALVIRLVIDLLDDALAVSLGAEAVRTGPEDTERIANLATRLGVDGLLGLLDRCLEADFHIARRVTLPLALEGLVDAWTQRVPAGTREG
jgi:DNA polymerase III subunit delta'